MESKKKVSPVKIIAAAAAVLILLVLVVEIAHYGITGRYLTFENNIYVRSAYTVSANRVDSGKMSRVVATMGDRSLTNGQLQVFYWTLVSSGDYDLGSYTPLSKQIYNEDTGMTWEQYLIEEALVLWQKYQAVADYAAADGFELPASYQAQLAYMQTYLQSYAENYGFSDVNSYLQAVIGAGCTLEDYVYFYELYFTAELYLQELMESREPTREELEAYFTAQEAELADAGVTKESGKVIDIRQILIAPEEDTQEAWDNSLETALLILNVWQAGEQNADSFGELAYEYSADSSASYGGLCQAITEGQLVEAMDVWCFDGSRAPGDCELLKTESGYCLVYYVYGAPAWEYNSRLGLREDMVDAWVRALLAERPIEVTYRKIVLGDTE